MKTAKKQAIILYLLFSLFIFNSSFVFAQSQSAQIEALLQSEAVTYAQAARFILDASGQLTTSNHDEAYRYAQEKKWLPGNAAADEQARLDRISLLFMNAFELKGGLFYSITKTPHYAYRELVYNNMIQGRTSPGMYVSGEQLIFYINRVLSVKDRDIELAMERERLRREREEAELARVQDELRERLRREAEERERERLAAAEEQRLELERIRAEADAAAENDLERERSREEARLRAAAAEREREEAQRIAGIVFPKIQFQPDSIRLIAGEYDKITEIVRLLNTAGDVKITITGHAAYTNAREHELEISLERANVVKRYLVSLGINENRITTVGLGPDCPTGDNNTEEGMAANRRAEITINK